MESIDVDGRTIRVHRQGEGRPVLYLHSGAGEVGPLLFFDELSSRGYEVIVPELPGFGHTEAAPEWRSIEDVVFHLRRAVDALDVGTPVLAGSSFGGWLAAELAVWCPSRFSALVLISALGLRVDGAPIFDLFGGPGTDPEEANRRSNPNGLDMLEALKGVIGSDDPEAIALHFIRATQTIAAVGWDPYMHDPRLRGRLASVDIPALVIWGASDGIVPVGHADAYVTALPDARSHILLGVGHGPILEQPAEVASTIGSFLVEHGLGAEAVSKT